MRFPGSDRQDGSMDSFDRNKRPSEPVERLKYKYSLCEIGNTDRKINKTITVSSKFLHILEACCVPVCEFA